MGKLGLDYIAGQNLKRAIKKSKWKTQANFAEAVGVETRTIERWCKRIDSVSRIEQLADFLGLSVPNMLSLE